MASIIEYVGKNSVSYQVRYRVNGKQRTKTFRSKNKTATAKRLARREAEKFIEDIEAKNTLGIAKDESNLTFKEYGEIVFEIINADLRETTKKNKEVYKKQVYEKIGHMKLKEITPLFLDKYFLELSKKKSHHVVERHRALINQVLESAFKKDLIVVNPMLKLDFKFKKGSLKEKKIVTEDDLKKILEYALEKPVRHKYYYFTLMAYYTGMRRGEILALTWDDVDFKAGVIHIKKSINRYGSVTEPKTKSAIREFVIYDTLSELLYEIKTRQDTLKLKYSNCYRYDLNLIICKDNGDYLTANAVDRFFNTASKALNFDPPIRPHRLRHTFATKIRGLEIKDVQALLGHSNTDTEITVNTYQHHDKYKEETIKHLNKAMHKFI